MKLLRVDLFSAYSPAVGSVMHLYIQWGRSMIIFPEYTSTISIAMEKESLNFCTSHVLAFFNESLYRTR